MYDIRTLILYIIVTEPAFVIKNIIKKITYTKIINLQHTCFIFVIQKIKYVSSIIKDT